MKRVLTIAIVLVMLLGLCACGGKAEQKAAEPKVFRVGFGRVNITPTSSHNLDGYSDRMSEGVLNPVMATCVAITDVDGNTILLYTVDMCNTEKETFGPLREQLTKETGIPGENITISATHTHSSPAYPYMFDYVERLVQAGKDALADRAPATIQGGSYDVPNMNFVRHYIKTDGTYAGDNYGNVYRDVVAHAEDADPTMRLIRFVREGDKKDVLMVNWQVHPKLASTADTAEGKATRNLISADFIGYARDYVETNEDVLFAYYNGASGNVNPFSMLPSEKNLVSREAKRYGEQFGDHVISALTELQALESGSVGAKTAPLGQEGGFNLHAYAAGDISFATVPAEIFSSTGQQIREGSPYAVTFVLTCANGGYGYIPSEFAYTCFASYEAGISSFASGTAETLEREYISMLTELHK